MLSPRQLEVARKIAEDKPNKIIAHEMKLTLGTVRQYVNAVIHRLGVNSRVGVAVWAVKQGVV